MTPHSKRNSAVHIFHYITYANIDPPDWFKPSTGAHFYIWVNYKTKAIWTDYPVKNSTKENYTWRIYGSDRHAEWVNLSGNELEAIRSVLPIFRDV